MNIFHLTTLDYTYICEAVIVAKYRRAKSRLVSEVRIPCGGPVANIFYQPQNDTFYGWVSETDTSQEGVITSSHLSELKNMLLKGLYLSWSKMITWRRVIRCKSEDPCAYVPWVVKNSTYFGVKWEFYREEVGVDNKGQVYTRKWADPEEDIMPLGFDPLVVLDPSWRPYNLKHPVPYSASMYRAARRYLNMDASPSSLVRMDPEIPWSSEQWKHIEDLLTSLRLYPIKQDVLESIAYLESLVEIQQSDKE